MEDASKFHEKIQTEFESLVKVTTLGQEFWKEMYYKDLIEKEKLDQIKVIL